MKTFMKKNKQTCLTMVILVIVAVVCIYFFQKKIVEKHENQTMTEAPITKAPTLSPYDKLSEQQQTHQKQITQQLAQLSQQNEEQRQQMSTDNIRQNIDNLSQNIQRNYDNQQQTDKQSSQTSVTMETENPSTKIVQQGDENVVDNTATKNNFFFKHSKRKQWIAFSLILLFLAIGFHILAIVMCFVCNKGKFDFMSFFGAIFFSPLYIIYQLTQGCSPHHTSVSRPKVSRPKVSSTSAMKKIIEQKPDVAALLK